MVKIAHDTMRLRKKKGLKRTDVSKATGIPYQRLRLGEIHGKAFDVTDTQAQKLAQMLGVPVADLVAYAGGGDGDGTEPQHDGATENAFRAGAHAVLRMLLREKIDDVRRETVRGLVESSWQAYLLGQKLGLQE